MRKRVVIVAVICCLLFCASIFARRIAWNPKEKPPVSLRLALALAEEELARVRIVTKGQ